MQYINACGKSITGYIKYILTAMTNVLTPMRNILTATSKKYLRLTPIEKKIILLLCTLYQWPVKLTRQNGGFDSFAFSSRSAKSTQ